MANLMGTDMVTRPLPAQQRFVIATRFELASNSIYAALHANLNRKSPINLILARIATNRDDFSIRFISLRE